MNLKSIPLFWGWRKPMSTRVHWSLNTRNKTAFAKVINDTETYHISVLSYMTSQSQWHPSNVTSFAILFSLVFMTPHSFGPTSICSIFSELMKFGFGQGFILRALFSCNIKSMYSAIGRTPHLHLGFFPQMSLLTICRPTPLPTASSRDLTGPRAQHVWTNDLPPTVSSPHLDSRHSCLLL